MQRICFHLQVRPELKDEYQNRHKQVWPEMLSALRDCGWHNYSLFLTQNGLLTGYLECEDFQEAKLAMSKYEINSKWQMEMAKYFIGLDGLTPDEAGSPVEEIFHLD